MNFFGCIPRFLKAHGGWVLTALGSLGLVGTVILTAQETPEAKRLVEEAEADSYSKWMDENVFPEESLDPEDFDAQMKENWENAGEWPDLTLWEKVKVAAPVYLPAILLGTGTLACFWGSQIFNAKKQAALVAAYGALALQFDQYREAIRAEHGEEADKRAYEVSLAEVQKLKNEIVKLKESHGPFLYEFATLPGVIFEETPAQISNALMHYNRNCLLRGGNDLAELYTFAGIPESCYDKKEARKYGWQEYENEVSWGAPYVDFMMAPVKNRFGRTVYVIDSQIPPYEVEVDYGFEGRVEDRLYEGYNPALARAFAEEIGGDEVVKVPEDLICYAPGVG